MKAEKADISESFHLSGSGWALCFPADRVPTFDDYRVLIPRGRRITNAFLGELEKQHILLAKGRIRNLVVTAGRNYVRDLIIGDVTGKLTHCGVGSSTQAPAAGDTALITPSGARVAVTDDYPSGTSAKFDTFFDSAHGSNSTTINETGLFTALTGGTMYNRSLVSPGIAKTSTNTVTISITVSQT